MMTAFAAMASGGVQRSNYTAIVHATDGVRFVATAPCPAALVSRVVGYISERCDSVLWPDAAREVRALIDDEKPYAAIALYFANVGDRWDEERLELGGLSFGSTAAARSGADSAAPSYR